MEESQIRLQTLKVRRRNSRLSIFVCLSTGFYIVLKYEYNTV